MLAGLRVPTHRAATVITCIQHISARSREWYCTVPVQVGSQGLPALRFRTQSCVGARTQRTGIDRSSVRSLSTESQRSVTNCCAVARRCRKAQQHTFPLPSFAPASTSASTPFVIIGAQTPPPSPSSREAFAPAVATQLHAPIRARLYCHRRPRSCTALRSNDNTTTSTNQHNNKGATTANGQLGSYGRPCCADDHIHSPSALLAIN